jgi:tetratricopeptide (TPR) repeat protein
MQVSIIKNAFIRFHLKTNYSKFYYQHYERHFIHKRMTSTCQFHTMSKHWHEQQEHEYDYFQQGMAYITANEYEEAVNSFSNALIQSKNSSATPVTIYYHRALLHSYLEHFEEALNDYTKCIDMDSEFVNAYMDRGDVYSSLERYEEAIQDYTTVINLKPSAEAYFERSHCYEALGFIQSAYDDSMQALKLSEYNIDYLEKTNKLHAYL